MYKIINWELADNAQITLINQKTNKVVAHFLIDNDYHLKLQEATFICNTLNKALQASDDKSKLLLADVSKCNCQTPVKCDNCGEMVVKISSGEFCPSCYC